MTKEPPDEFQDNDRAEEENEEELDDNDYVPRFIQKVLDNPELLPREIRADFVSVFEDFEYTHHGRAKTALEYIMVSEAAKIVLGLQRLDRIENAILINHQRSAVESLLRKTHKHSHVIDAKAAIHSGANLSAEQYFYDPEFKAESDKKFEAFGFGPNAVEGEAYILALPSLAVIHRQKAADRKTLFGILKELEAKYVSRHREKKMVVRKPGAKTSEAEHD